MTIAGGGVEKKWPPRHHVAFLQGTIHLAFDGALEWST